MRSSIVAVVLITAAFAGCSDDGPGSGSAMSGLAKANARAEDWNAEAALIGIVGIEAGAELIAEVRADMEDEGDDMPDEFWAAVPRSDGSMGDGRAPAWMYVYSHEDHLYLVIVSGGKVTFADSNFTDDLVEDLSHNGIEPVGDFEIDSDEAADIAAEADDNYTQAGKGGRGFAFYSLGRTEGRAIWTMSVGAETDDGEEEFAVVQIAADTGEVLASDGDGLITLPEQVLQETGDFSETASATEGASGDFDLGDGHMSLSIRGSAELMTPLSTLTLSIQDPAGTVHELVVSNGMGVQPASVSNNIDIPMPIGGTWTVTAELEQGVTQEFTVEYCTDGMPNGENPPNAACSV